VITATRIDRLVDDALPSHAELFPAKLDSQSALQSIA
jgi:hypothetical protein